MYPWYYHVAGPPQNVSVVVAAYHYAPYMVAGPHSSWVANPSDPRTTSVSDTQWYYSQQQSHSTSPAYNQWPPNPPPCQPQTPRQQYSPWPSSLPSPNIQASSEEFPIPEAIRGPPRKPRQSGHALWVGNLPHNTQLQELIDFFALDGLESIFLIRKSNCAFVNYSTQHTCEEALAAFHLKGNAPLSASYIR
jgi:RNA recognition motif. (a.k.a. RRM, RBD, or RNP domain)